MKEFLHDLGFSATLGLASGITTSLLMPEVVHIVTTVIGGTLTAICIFIVTKLLKKIWPDKHKKE